MKKKTNILFVDQAIAFGGSIVVIADLLSDIDRKKYESIFVGEMDIDLLKYYLKDNAKIIKLQHLYNYKKNETAKNWIIKKLPKIIQKLTIYTLALVTFPGFIIYTFKFGYILLKENVDIVHINNGMGNREALLASYLLRKKIVVHFHGYGDFKLFHKIFIPKVNQYIAISEFIKNILIIKGIPKGAIKLLPNPVVGKVIPSGTKEVVCKQYGINQDEIIFGIFGRIVRWKGHIEFINATEKVVKSIPNAKAVIVGDYSDGDISYQEKIEKMVAEKQLENKIVFTGYIKEVERIYSIMDLVVHTSIDPEPFGLVITEAMSYGIPVIASNLGAPKEIITDGIDGYIVDPTSTEILASKIIELLTNIDRRESMGKLAKEKVLKKYNIKNYTREIEDIYTQVMVLK
jgi:glycosyltransferase involved in cell wall biosynthesis